MSWSEGMLRIARRILEEKARAEGYQKPLPTITPLTKPFWEGCKGHQLRLQYCPRCERYQFFPKPWCEECGELELEWRRASGRGTLYSYTIVRQVVANSPAFSSDIPFVIGIVELDEGPRICAVIEDAPLEGLELGSRVEVTFQDVSDEVALPRFRLVAGPKPKGS